MSYYTGLGDNVVDAVAAHNAVRLDPVPVDAITNRIDDAMTLAIKKGARGFRALYLTPADHKALKDQLGKRFYADVTHYRTVTIRRGSKWSRLYDLSGTSTAVRKSSP